MIMHYMDETDTIDYWYWYVLVNDQTFRTTAEAIHSMLTAEAVEPGLAYTDAGEYAERVPATGALKHITFNIGQYREATLDRIFGALMTREVHGFVGGCIDYLADHAHFGLLEGHETDWVTYTVAENVEVAGVQVDIVDSITARLWARDSGREYVIRYALFVRPYIGDPMYRYNLRHLRLMYPPGRPVPQHVGSLEDTFLHLQHLNMAQAHGAVEHEDPHAAALHIVCDVVWRWLLTNRPVLQLCLFDLVMELVLHTRRDASHFVAMFGGPGARRPGFTALAPAVLVGATQLSLWAINDESDDAVVMHRKLTTIRGQVMIEHRSYVVLAVDEDTFRAEFEERTGRSPLGRTRSSRRKQHQLAALLMPLLVVDVEDRFATVAPVPVTVVGGGGPVSETAASSSSPALPMAMSTDSLTSGYSSGPAVRVTARSPRRRSRPSTPDPVTPTRMPVYDTPNTPATPEASHWLTSPAPALMYPFDETPPPAYHRAMRLRPTTAPAYTSPAETPPSPRRSPSPPAGRGRGRRSVRRRLFY